jgi:hypothetical protein
MSYFQLGDKYKVTRKGLTFIDNGKVIEIKKGVIGEVVKSQDAYGVLTIKFGKQKITTVATDLTGYVKEKLK